MIAPSLLTEHASPNYDVRRKSISLLLLHYTGMPTYAEALARLCHKDSKVSAHYLLDEQGRVARLVKEKHRAWHAGDAYWQGEKDINSMAVGIELANPGHGDSYRDFPKAQMLSLKNLCADIMRRHSIAPRRVLGHSDVAPHRKQDPGEKFDWSYLARAGIGVWPQNPPAKGGKVLAGKGSVSPQVTALQKSLQDYGYSIDVNGIFDTSTVHAVTAFQRHFFPTHVTGVWNEGSQAILQQLHQLP